MERLIISGQRGEVVPWPIQVMPVAGPRLKERKEENAVVYGNEVNLVEYRVRQRQRRQSNHD
jgi:hypothetical protein